MRRASFALVLPAAAPSAAIASFETHGPFPDDASIPHVALVELASEPVVSDDDGIQTRAFHLPDRPEVRLVAMQSDTTLRVALTIDDRAVLPTTTVLDHHTWASSAFAADLNGDRMTDFVVASNPGGNGLGARLEDVTFLLSADGGYRATTIPTLGLRCEDFVILDGTTCFIQSALLPVETCNDGKRHSFWVHRRLVPRRDGSLVLDEGPATGFPRTIWFTFRPNHAETTIITAEQKAALLKRSTATLFPPADAHEPSPSEATTRHEAAHRPDVAG